MRLFSKLRCFPKPGFRKSPGCWWRQPTVTCTCTTWIHRRAGSARSWSSTGEVLRPLWWFGSCRAAWAKSCYQRCLFFLMLSGWTAALSQPVRFWIRRHMIGHSWRKPIVLPSLKVCHQVSSKYLNTFPIPPFVCLLSRFFFSFLFNILNIFMKKTFFITFFLYIFFSCIILPCV